LAEQAERYDEMVACMQKVVQNNPDLSIEERNLLSALDDPESHVCSAAPAIEEDEEEARARVLGACRCRLPCRCLKNGSVIQ